MTVNDLTGTLFIGNLNSRWSIFKDYILKVHIIKTDNKKITTGSAKADTIKRVYTKTINLKTYDYNLTENIVKIKSDYEQ